MSIKHKTKVRWSLASWLFVLSAIAYLDRTNLSIAGLQIGHEFGLGNQRLGWMASAFLIGYAAFQVPAGWVSARFGARLVLTVGVLWWGIATIFTALLPSSTTHAVLFLVALRFGLGVGESIIYPAATLLTWFILHHGWRSAFWFSAVVGILAGVIWWWIARDRPETHPLVGETELRLIREVSPSDSPDHTVSENGRHRQPESNKISWKLILHRSDLLALMGAYFGFLYVAWVYFSWFFIYMAQVRGFDLKASARYTMLPFLSMTIFCLLGGKLTDVLTRRYGLRVGRCGLAASASLLTAVFLVLGSQLHNPQL
ncbi:MAG: MFS transporter, partial [Acidobacteria bacterium]|nr:MFS transporter [Acidobacteriota bacterium]